MSEMFGPDGATEINMRALGTALLAICHSAFGLPRRLGPNPTTRRAALSTSAAALLASSAILPPALAAVTQGYNPGESAEDLADGLGGLKPGTGRSLNALIKMRAETGVERLGTASPLFKAGQILDEVRAQDGSAVSISFAFPEPWVLAGGPNLDVRDIKESDSAYLLVAPLPADARGSIEKVPQSFFLETIFASTGKVRPVLPPGLSSSAALGGQRARAL